MIALCLICENVKGLTGKVRTESWQWRHKCCYTVELTPKSNCPPSSNIYIGIIFRYSGPLQRCKMKACFTICSQNPFSLCFLFFVHFIKALCQVGPLNIQLTVTNHHEGLGPRAPSSSSASRSFFSLQLLLYSDEGLICSTCYCVVMLAVHFKGSLQMKASLSFPSLCVCLRRIMGALFDANDVVTHHHHHHHPRTPHPSALRTPSPPTRM